MGKIISFKKCLTIFFLIFVGECAYPQDDVTKYVDPNIGGVAPLLTTVKPTVHRPHGMVRIFPVTEPGLSDRYLSDKIYGFALNMPAYRMPHVTDIMPVHGKIPFTQNQSAATYDHDLEEVHPWYHKVLLEEPDIEAEWTTTERALIYRFSFHRPDSNHFVLRTRGNAQIKFGNNSVSGWEEFQDTPQYFYIEINQPPRNFNFVTKRRINKAIRTYRQWPCCSWEF